MYPTVTKIEKKMKPLNFSSYVIFLHFVGWLERQKYNRMKDEIFLLYCSIHIQVSLG